MLRNGVDLLEISRLQGMKENQPAIYERFLKRVYTRNEIQESDGRFSYLAGRFAAKEAAAKALACGVGSIGWQSVEVLSGELGQPVLHLHDKAAEKAAELGVQQWSISISHTDTLVIAAVVMQ